MKGKDLTLSDFPSTKSTQIQPLCNHSNFILFGRGTTGKLLCSHRSLSTKSGNYCRKKYMVMINFTPAYKTRKNRKILSLIPNCTTMNQLHLAKNIIFRRGLERTGLRGKIPGTLTLLTPEIFPQSPQIQRLTLPS